MDNIPDFKENEVIISEQFARSLAVMAVYVACTYPGKDEKVKLHVEYDARSSKYVVTDRGDGTVYIESGLNYLKLYPYGDTNSDVLLT